MSDPSLGLTMLGLIVVAIMMGYPTAFTLMGLGMVFGFIAFWIPARHWYDNRVFDLIAQRTYGVMTNDTLLSVPLFVFMGYIMERAALVDRMFHSVQLAFRRVPASLAVTTLLVCAFWGIASGIVGAVVVLMGVIALRPMLKAGYDIRLASGAITAGGTLGHPDPALGHADRLRGGGGPVDRQALRGRDAAGLLPDVPLPRLHPRLGDHQPEDRAQAAARPVPRGRARTTSAALERGRSRSVVPGLIAAAGAAGARRAAAGYRAIARDLAAIAVPVLLTVGTFAATWWYVVVYNAPEVTRGRPGAGPTSCRGRHRRRRAGAASPPSEEQAQELARPARARPRRSSARPASPRARRRRRETEGPPEEMTSLRDATAATVGGQGARALLCLVLGAGRLRPRCSCSFYFWRMDGEQLEILKELIASVVPLGVLTAVVLAVILFGICTATESAAIGALGALYLAVMARYAREVWWWSLVGVDRRRRARLVAGRGPGVAAGGRRRSAGTFLGTVVPGLRHLRDSKELRENLKQSTFLTAKTTAMVCWLFVGSALFSAVFALHGGQALIERWVLEHEPLAAGVHCSSPSSSSSCSAGRSSGPRSS